MSFTENDVAVTTLLCKGQLQFWYTDVCRRSRASLADSTSMSDNFQVFTMELEILTPFDSIKVAPERLALLQKSTVRDLVLETLRTSVLTGWPQKESNAQYKVAITGIIEKRFRSTTEFCLRVRE